MDADFSHDPDDLERLRSACERSPIVIGSRYIPGGRVEGWAKHRELLSRAANVYARVFTRVPVHDLTGGFKCFRAEALRALPLGEIRSEGYAFQIETTTRLFRAGFPPVEVPIVFRERRFGTSKISRNVVFEAIGVVLRLAFK